MAKIKTDNQNDTRAPETVVPETSRENLHEFVAEVDCIYNGLYTSAGTRIQAAAESVPHFKRVS
jgi:hypothetical protein